MIGLRRGRYRPLRSTRARRARGIRALGTSARQRSEHLGVDPPRLRRRVRAAVSNRSRSPRFVLLEVRAGPVHVNRALDDRALAGRRLSGRHIESRAGASMMASTRRRAPRFVVDRPPRAVLSGSHLSRVVENDARPPSIAPAGHCGSPLVDLAPVSERDRVRRDVEVLAVLERRFARRRRRRSNVSTRARAMRGRTAPDHGTDDAEQLARIAHRLARQCARRASSYGRYNFVPRGDHAARR